MAPRVRVSSLLQKKAAGEKIVMMTAYDYPTGRLIDEAGVDVVLVGDSLGNTILGFEDTIPVTLEHMVHHTAAVVRGVERAFVVGDMPFMTYKIAPEEALRNAGRLVQEGGAGAVKLEGGREICPMVRKIVDAGIPVMGHLGLTPQSVHALSGYRVQGRDEENARRLTEDAQALQEAGCCAVVLELVVSRVARQVTQALDVPTIGVGSGVDCDGQAMVLCDLIGLSFGKVPKFVRPYGDVAGEIRGAVEGFAKDVREGAYPGEEHGYE